MRFKGNELNDTNWICVRKNSSIFLFRRNKNRTKSKSNILIVSSFSLFLKILFMMRQFGLYSICFGIESSFSFFVFASFSICSFHHLQSIYKKKVLWRQTIISDWIELKMKRNMKLYRIMKRGFWDNCLHFQLIFQCSTLLLLFKITFNRHHFQFEWKLVCEKVSLHFQSFVWRVTFIHHKRKYTHTHAHTHRLSIDISKQAKFTSMLMRFLAEQN